MTYRHILLDFDGTLVDSMPAIVEATRLCFAEAGLPEPQEAAVRTAIADGIGLGSALAALHPSVRPQDEAAWIARWRRFYNDMGIGDTAQPYPGALDVLRTFNDAGLAVAVVSNKGQVALDKAVRRLELGGLLAAVVGEEPGQPGKPSPEVFTRRLRAAMPDALAAECLMVGDSESDLAFAANIGAAGCYAAYGYGNPARCRALAPRHSIDDIRDLPALAGLG